MNARKMFAVLTLAIAMFFTVAANAQTTKPAPKTEKKPAATGEKKPMGHKKGHKKSHHKKSHKKSSGKKSTGTTKPAPKKS